MKHLPEGSLVLNCVIESAMDRLIAVRQRIGDGVIFIEAQNNYAEAASGFRSICVGLSHDGAVALRSWLSAQLDVEPVEPDPVVEMTERMRASFRQSADPDDRAVVTARIRSQIEALQKELRELRAVGSDRLESEGWVEIGKRCSAGRRSMWLRPFDSKGELLDAMGGASRIELCAGREGNDVEVAIDETNPQWRELLDLFSTAAFAAIT